MAANSVATYVRCASAASATRSTADFDALAVALANHSVRPQHVLALDYRGRGQSDYDANPDHYNIAVELADVLAVLTALEIAPAVFVGTSRGDDRGSRGALPRPRPDCAQFG